MSRASDICQFSKVGMLYEFRVSEGRVERRITNVDGSIIHPSISNWKIVSNIYILHIKTEYPEFKKWLGRQQFKLAQDEVI